MLLFALGWMGMTYVSTKLHEEQPPATRAEASLDDPDDDGRPGDADA